MQFGRCPAIRDVEGRQTFDQLTHEVEHHRIRHPHFPFNHNLPANQTKLLLEQVSGRVRSFLRKSPSDAKCVMRQFQVHSRIPTRVDAPAKMAKSKRFRRSALVVGQVTQFAVRQKLIDLVVADVWQQRTGFERRVDEQPDRRRSWRAIE